DEAKAGHDQPSVAAATAAGGAEATLGSFARRLPVGAEAILGGLGGGLRRALGQLLGVVRLDDDAAAGAARTGDEDRESERALHRARCLYKSQPRARATAGSSAWRAALRRRSSAAMARASGGDMA